jgi:hypothetical protein
MDRSPLMRLSTQGGRFVYGPLLRRFRSMRTFSHTDL